MQYIQKWNCKGINTKLTVYCFNRCGDKPIYVTGSGIEYGLLQTLQQVIQVLSIPLTYCRADGIQNFCLMAVTVLFTPPCSTVAWAANTINAVSGCFDGNSKSSSIIL